MPIYETYVAAVSMKYNAELMITTDRQVNQNGNLYILCNILVMLMSPNNKALL